jgi:hypothetical protein
MREEHLESSKREREPLKERVLRNLDAIAAILGVAFIGLYIGGVVLGPPADHHAVLLDLEERRESTATGFDEAAFDLGDYEQRLTAAELRVRTLWGPAPEPKRPLPPPAALTVTYPDLLVGMVRGELQNEITFPPPQDVRGDAEPGRNHVLWTIHQDNNVDLSGFSILRRVGDGAFQALATVDADTREYEDRAVTPGVKYGYRIVAMTADPVLVRQGVRETEPSAPITLDGVADFKVTLVSADPDRSEAVFDVEKLHEGAFRLKRFTASLNGVVGGNDPGAGVDYTTGRVVKKIDAKPMTEIRERFAVIFDEHAKVKLKDGVPVTEKLEIEESFLSVSVLLEGGGLPPETLVHEKRP